MSTYLKASNLQNLKNDVSKHQQLILENAWMLLVVNVL